MKLKVIFQLRIVMANQNSLIAIEERFASELRNALRKRYGSIPSAAFVTIQFNRRLVSKNGVSQESVRRWMRGLSMPSYLHLQILALWLGLSLDSLLGVEEKKESVIPSFAHFSPVIVSI